MIITKRVRFGFYTFLATAVFMVLSSLSFATVKSKPKVLIFSKTAGFHHNSIAVGIVAIKQLGTENNFDVDTTTDANKFNTSNLKQYAAIIFLSTTGKVFTTMEQENALKRYIESGKGYVGIHAATDCEYDWQWYGDLAGAYFKGHPAGTPEATLNVVDSTFMATKHLPRRWTRKDEWYHFKFLAKDLHVLIQLDENSFTYSARNESLKMGSYHPMAWYHSFDGGRAFYTALGHTDESFADPLYLQHILAGIKYAIGKNYKK
jgi:type 1 glutamine amidotransferase